MDNWFPIVPVKQSTKHSFNLIKNWNYVITSNDASEFAANWSGVNATATLQSLSSDQVQMCIRKYSQSSRSKEFAECTAAQHNHFMEFLTKSIQKECKPKGNVNVWMENATNCRILSLIATSNPFSGDKLYIDVNKNFLNKLRNYVYPISLKISGSIISEKMKRDEWEWEIGSSREFKLCIDCAHNASINSDNMKSTVRFNANVDNKSSAIWYMWRAVDKMLYQVGSRFIWNLRTKLNVTLEWTEETLTIPIKLKEGSVLQNLLENDVSKDFAFVSGNGAEVKCHKLILAASSPVFAAMVSPKWTKNSAEVDRVEVREMSEVGITLLVHYLYGQELTSTSLDLECDLVTELFQAAHKYELKQFENALASLILHKGMDWFTPNETLELYFYLKNLDSFGILKDRLISVIVRMSKEIRESEMFQGLNPNQAQSILDHIMALSNNAKTTN